MKILWNSVSVLIFCNEAAKNYRAAKYKIIQNFLSSLNWYCSEKLFKWLLTKQYQINVQCTNIWIDGRGIWKTEHSYQLNITFLFLKATVKKKKQFILTRTILISVSYNFRFLLKKKCACVQCNFLHFQNIWCSRKFFHPMARNISGVQTTRCYSKVWEIHFFLNISIPRTLFSSITFEVLPIGTLTLIPAPFPRSERLAEVIFCYRIQPCLRFFLDLVYGVKSSPFQFNFNCWEEEEVAGS